MLIAVFFSFFRAPLEDNQEGNLCIEASVKQQVCVDTGDIGDVIYVKITD